MHRAALEDSLSLMPLHLPYLLGVSSSSAWIFALLSLLRNLCTTPLAGTSWDSEGGALQGGWGKNKESFPARVRTESRIFRVGVYNAIDPLLLLSQSQCRKELVPFCLPWGQWPSVTKEPLTEKCVNKRRLR